MVGMINCRFLESHTCHPTSFSHSSVGRASPTSQERSVPCPRSQSSHTVKQGLEPKSFVLSDS